MTAARRGDPRRSQRRHNNGTSTANRQTRIGATQPQECATEQRMSTGAACQEARNVREAHEDREGHEVVAAVCGSMVSAIAALQL